MLGIRPTDLLEDQQAAEALPRIEVVCDVVEYLGTEANVLFRFDALPVEGIAPEVDTRFTARVGRATTARAGERVRLAVDVGRLYFFDAATGGTLVSPSDIAADS